MQSIVVREPGAPLKLEEVPLPEPGPGEVRIRIRACGICHSDLAVVQAAYPGLKLPRTPGHEIAGTVDALGDGVDNFRKGDRVGLGWHGGHDGSCDACLQGQFIHCDNGRITGISFDGGYAEYTVAAANALARIPETMDFAKAAPLLCAGVTTFNSLRNTGARPGDLVAVQGLGGLGHLGVQYAAAMGFEVVAVSRGKAKQEFAQQLGAHHYVDTEAGDPGAALTKLGGARVVLATAPHAKAIAKLLPGLGRKGCLLIVAAPFEPMSFSPIHLLSRDASIQGWSSGSAIDSTDAISFAALHGIEPLIETFPLAEAQAAYEHMTSGAVRFRSVLEM